jgi:hypothetical protein
MFVTENRGIDTFRYILNEAKAVGFKGAINLAPHKGLCLNTLVYDVPNGQLTLKYFLTQTSEDEPIVGNMWLNFSSMVPMYDRQLISLCGGYTDNNVGPKVFVDLLKHIDTIKDHLKIGEDDEEIAIQKWINDSCFEVLD